MSKTLDKISFWSLFVVIVFLPILFLPFTTIPLETAKGFLLVLGLVTSIIFWTIARFTEGKITLPKSYILLSGFALVLAFFASSYHSVVRSVSMFGVMFDFGSFYYILATFLLMAMCAIVVRNLKDAKIILLGFIFSSVLLFVFQIAHLFYPTALGLGVLVDKTDNIMGSWNAFGIFAACFVVLALFIIEFFKIPKGAKWVLGVFSLLALFLVVAVNFYLSWAILEILALIIFIYKISYSYNINQTQEVKRYFPFASFAVFIFAMFFFIATPAIGGYLSNRLGLVNIDASPTLNSNFTVAKSVLQNHKFLGVGLNRFGESWAMYKPITANSGPFWNNYFDFGRGVIPTFASVTGYVGVFAILLFFIMFLLSGFRSLFNSIKDGVSWGSVIFFLGAFSLFVACFFYPTGPVLFVLAMAFTGIFVGVSTGSNPDKEISIVFSNNPKKSFLFLFLLMGVLVGSSSLAFKYLERFASVPSLRRAVIETNNSAVAVPAVEKALSLNPNDLYYRTASQVYLTQFVVLASKNEKISEEDSRTMESALDKAIKSAMSAVEFNKNNYLNFQILGSVYFNAGQLGVNGSFVKAVDAYSQASLLNPLSPGLKLSIARAYFLDGKKTEAEKLASESIALKPDYIDALILMSQIKKSNGSNTEALNYAETARAYTENILLQYPNDTLYLNRKKDLIQYIDSLNVSNQSSSTSTKTKNSNTDN